MVPASWFRGAQPKAVSGASPLASTSAQPSTRHAVAGEDGALRQLRMLHQAIVDRAEQGELSALC